MCAPEAGADAADASAEAMAKGLPLDLDFVHVLGAEREAEAPRGGSQVSAGDLCAAPCTPRWCVVLLKRHSSIARRPGRTCKHVRCSRLPPHYFYLVDSWFRRLPPYDAYAKA